MSQIECACDYDAYDHDYTWEWHRTSKRKARKEHQCCECSAAITVGAEYEYKVGFCRKPVGNGIEDFATCEPCRRIRESLAPSCPAGMLREHLYECLGFDYVTNESYWDEDDEEDEEDEEAKPGAGEEA